MAPEQATSQRGFDERADLYALGITLFELLTGAPPFAGRGVVEVLQCKLTDAIPDVRQDRPEVSAGTAVLIQRLCERDPNLRPGGARVVVVEVERLLGALASKVPREDPRPSVSSSSRQAAVHSPSMEEASMHVARVRRRRWRDVGLGVLVGLVLAVAYVLAI
jgi:serine/threonine-protein kinase